MARYSTSLFKLLSIIVLHSFLWACSSSKSTGENSLLPTSPNDSRQVQPKNIEYLVDIPKIMGELGISTQSINSAKLRQYSTSVGTALKDTDDATIWTGKSRPMCEMSFFNRELFLTAGSTDNILCQMSELEKRQKFTLEPPELRYDNGEPGVYVILVGGEVKKRINLQIIKSRGVIRNVNLYLCKEVGSNVYAQTDSLQFVSGQSTEIYAKNLTTVGTRTWWSEVSFGGILNAGAQWEARSYEAKLHSTDTSTSKTFIQNVSATNRSGDLQVTGYGKYEAPGVANDAEVKLFGKMQLINPESASSVAIGDGTLIGSIIYGNKNISYGDMSWQGEARSADSTSPYFAEVHEAEPESYLNLEAYVTVGFGVNSVCDDPAPPGYVAAIELSSAEWDEILNTCSAYEMGSTEKRGEYACGSM